MDSPSGTGSVTANPSVLQDALAVGGDEKALPQLAARPDFDRPVARAADLARRVDPQHELRDRAFWQRLLPRLGLGQVLDARDRAAQRRACVIWNVARERRCSDRQNQ